jgi:hypothetical protein
MSDQLHIDKSNTTEPHKFGLPELFSKRRVPMKELPEEPWIHYQFFGMSFSMSYPIHAIFVQSFNFGYLDTAAYIRFGCFTCIQTGNIAILTSNVFLPALGQLQKVGPLTALPTNERIAFIITQLLVSTFAGGWLVSGLEFYLCNRKKTLVMLLALLGVSTVVTDALLNNRLTKGVVTGSDVEWVALLIALSLGALSFWSSQLGRTLNVQTMNLHKLGLAIGKFGCCFEQGGAKGRGDTLALCATLAGFIAGSFVAANVMSSSAYKMCFSLFACSLPVQILISGCWREFVELLRHVLVDPFTRKTAETDDAASEIVQMQGVTNAGSVEASSRETSNPMTERSV